MHFTVMKKNYWSEYYILCYLCFILKAKNKNKDNSSSQIRNKNCKVMIKDQTSEITGQVLMHVLQICIQKTSKLCNFSIILNVLLSSKLLHTSFHFNTNFLIVVFGQCSKGGAFGAICLFKNKIIKIICLTLCLIQFDTFGSAFLDRSKHRIWPTAPWLLLLFKSKTDRTGNVDSAAFMV